MKKAFFFLLTLSFAGAALGFTEVITYLKGHPDTDAIVLDWQSGVETGVKSYAIERSDIKSNNFNEIGSLAATGNNSTYHYRDAGINGAPSGTAGHSVMPLSDLYKYRIRLNYDNAVSYSETIQVTRPSAGVKRTWGMIKEMFR